MKIHKVPRTVFLLILLLFTPFSSALELHPDTLFDLDEPLLNQTTYYISDNFIQIINATGSYNTTYYTEGDTLIARKDPDGHKFFYHPDNLGSTDTVTNENGDVVEETTYKPYGQVQSGGESRFLFTGKELDKEMEDSLL